MEYLYKNGFHVITIEDLGYDKYKERFYVKNNVNTLRSGSQVLDVSPSGTETIQTQTVAQETQDSQFQNRIPTWFKTDKIE
jgi:hypothetical protein